MTAKEQCEILLDKLLPFAEEQMKKYREFYPFAAVLRTDDTTELTAHYDGNEHPEAKEELEKLKQLHQYLAAEGSIKASGIAWNASVTSANGKPTDAIIVSLEHEDGYSVIIAKPYKIGLFKKVKFEPLFAMLGMHDIFPEAEATPQDFRVQLQETVISPMAAYMNGCKECGFTKADVAKCESLILTYLSALENLAEPTNEKIMQHVQTLVLALNELNEKTDFCLLETEERECICEIIQSSAITYGLTDPEDDITEEWREW